MLADGTVYVDGIAYVDGIELVGGRRPVVHSDSFQTAPAIIRRSDIEQVVREVLEGAVSVPEDDAYPTVNPALERVVIAVLSCLMAEAFAEHTTLDEQVIKAKRRLGMTREETVSEEVLTAGLPLPLGSQRVFGMEMQGVPLVEGMHFELDREKGTITITAEGLRWVQAESDRDALAGTEEPAA